MRKIVAGILLFAICSIATLGPQAQTPQTKTQDQPFVVEYYYKARWGYADEFLRLFKKNHLPVLQKQIEQGRIVSVKVEKPRYHATEDGRWDFRVTITFKSATIAFAPFDEAALTRQLYPDQATFKRE